MKKLIQIILFSVSFVFITSCKKDKAKHLIAGAWVNDNPSKYAFSAGGQNLGVGATDLQWEILEMDFTKAEERFPNGYYGPSGSGTMLVNEYKSNGTIENFTFDWGFWEYIDRSKASDNPLREQTAVSPIPQELKDQEKVVGELFNKSGSLRFYVFDLKRNSMTLAFAHLNSFSSGTNNWYYSPIMTFSRKK